MKSSTSSEYNESRRTTTPEIHYYMSKDAGCYYVVNYTKKEIKLRLIISPMETYNIPWTKKSENYFSKLTELPEEQVNLILKTSYLILAEKN